MKSNFLWIIVAVICAALSMSMMVEAGSVKGIITPPDAVNQVWLVSDQDTLKTSADKGYFEFPRVEPGSYTLSIDAMDPYKDQSMDVTVKSTEVVDLGSILLEK